MPAHHEEARTDGQRGRPSASIERLAELADYCTPIALRQVADLGIADILATNPLPVTEIAARTGTHAPSLLRVLRALASRGLFTEESPERFANNSLSALLRTDHPLSMRDSLTPIPSQLRAWSDFGHTVKTGEPAFDHVHGQTEWEYLSTHPDEAMRFNRSMRSLTVLILRTSIRAYPWTDLGTVVDIGGGDGTFIAGLLTRYKELRGVVVDLPHVAAAAAENARKAGLGMRLEIIPGDIFKSLPAGHGGYILKFILHAFADDMAFTILTRVRGAMRADSKLIVIDSLLSTGSGADLGRIMDLQMLATTRGHERTEAEFRELFAAARLRLSALVPTRGLPLMEVVPD